MFVIQYTHLVASEVVHHTREVSWPSGCNRGVFEWRDESGLQPCVKNLRFYSIRCITVTSKDHFFNCYQLAHSRWTLRIVILTACKNSIFIIVKAFGNDFRMNCWKCGLILHLVFYVIQLGSKCKSLRQGKNWTSWLFYCNDYSETNYLD